MILCQIMPRRAPTGKLDVIGKLELSPEKACGFYLESKQQDKYFLKPQQWDNVGDSIELISIKNEREYLAMTKLQREMMESAQRQKILNAHRIEEMYKTQKDLREKFININQFIQECETKRNKAEKKVQMQLKLQQDLKDKINKFQNDIAELTDFRDNLSVIVKEFEPYETVIEEVVAKSGILKSVKECMDRCDALMLAQTEIAELEQEKIKSIEDMRQKMVKATNDAELTILGLTTHLTELERAYNDARSESFKWEKLMATTKDCIAENELTCDRVMDAIQNMYKILCKRNEIDPEYKREDIESILDFIKDEVEILQTVVKICHQKLEKKKV
ncbi:uncharacterized protein LOC129610161 [Condylostylus longicornis]|uniref:uncharacterized protein LOC129610161 n=1 Tax=Condylostylus longicornis TaxID=2530218 RepID=UPI00244E2A45|nr:uncharacterized protein LOC129610161 [Condylostylus longicornis]